MSAATAAERLALRTQAAATRANSRTLRTQATLLRSRIPITKYTQDDILEIIKKKLIPRTTSTPPPGEATTPHERSDRSVPSPTSSSAPTSS